MAVKVTSITPWIHHSWIKKAAASTDPDDGQRPSMTQLALLQPPPRSWLVNTQWKPENLPIRT
jgi:hypothetical protein